MKYLMFCSAILLMACSSCKTKKQLYGSFTGFKDKIIKDTNLNDFRIMIVHGTGLKDFYYADSFINRLTRKMYKKAVFCDYSQISLGQDSGYIMVKKYCMGRDTVRFYIVRWSDVTLNYKKWLFENENTNRQSAVINRQLKKKVMLDNLSDFVYYSGNSMKDKIRHPIRMCIRLMFIDETKYDDNEDALRKAILDPQDADFVVNEQRKILLITGSLGSKATLDVLSDPQFVNKGIETTMYEKYKEQMMGIYMLSHQVPLLSSQYIDRFRLDTASLKTLRKWYDYQNYYGVCNFAQKVKASEKIDYVAFHDPNDLLGYKFMDCEITCQCERYDYNSHYFVDCQESEEFAKKNIKVFKDCQEYEESARKINKVIYSVHNSKHFLWLYSSIEKSHTRIWDNRMLVRILIKGAKPKKQWLRDQKLQKQ